MQKLLRKIWNIHDSEPNERPVVDDAVSVDWSDVPRYPPYAEGYPAVSIDQILGSQSELINKITNEASFSSRVFNDVVVPVIRNYAGYVHLLPASQSNHHSGAGGLFRHGLEVGHVALRKAQAKRFNTGVTQENRRNNEHVWHMAAFIAGLLHDIGKPVIDMAVNDKDGNQWSPTFEYIDQWAHEHGVDRYYIRWLGNRGKRHELMTSVNLAKLVGDDATLYIRDHDEEIFYALCEAAIGRGLEGPLAHLVMEADKASVSHDLRNKRSPGGYGMPVDRFLLDAMRRLVKCKKWQPNEPGSVVWVLRSGVYIHWNVAVNDVLSLIQKDGTPGIPREPDTLASILVEQGVAIARPVEGASGSGEYYRYWKCSVPVDREGMVGEAVFQGLRLEAPEDLFTDEIPEAVEGLVEGVPVPGTGAQCSGDAAEAVDPVEDQSPETMSGPAPVDQSSHQTDTVAVNCETGVSSEGVLPMGNGAEEPETTSSSEESETAPGQLDGVGAIGNLNASINDRLNMLSPFQKAIDTDKEQPADSKSKELDTPKEPSPKEIEPCPTATEQPSSNFTVSPSLTPETGPSTKAASPEIRTKAQPIPAPVQKASDRPILTTNSDSLRVGPQCSQKDSLVEAVDALKAKTASYGRAGEIVVKETEKVLNGGILGERLYVFEGTVLLLHPETTTEYGEIKEVVSLMSSSGILDMGPTGMRAINERNGVRGLLLKPEVARAVVTCFEQAEQSLFPEMEPPVQQAPERKLVSNKGRRKQHLLSTAAEGTTEEKSETAKPDGSTPEEQSTRIAPPVMDTDSKPAEQASSRIGVAKLPRRNMKRDLPEADLQPGKKYPKNGNIPPKARNEDHQIAENKGTGFPQKEGSVVERVVEEFIEQVRQGGGDLVVGVPRDEDGLRWVGDQSINLMCGRNLEMKPLEVRLQIRRHSRIEMSNRQIGVRI